ncbi:stage IV sporulation protein A [[Clostridium] colinum]|uniref:stage IV sporulation protein A n=1 Tax=[Clostridium] colinum TaxID=36835 RepID=UPI002023C51E|nr:stage IV sporulation protein A [[Clostridium] colinum]
MEHFNIYKDIAERTNGDIYIGVVGPVRTGKSTFIKRFMDLLVIPNIEDEHNKERTKDELPQSSAGKTIMTTEPKFIPNNAVCINLENNAKFNVRMIDCVGYVVPGASGYMDENQPRMVSTPWFNEKIPFEEAAEIGTKKVITDHSTIGIVVTTDGTITDIPREDYIIAEEKVIKELKSLSKPFVILLNTEKPYSQATEILKQDLTEKYNSPVIAVNIAQLKQDDINSILEKVLYEFPIKQLNINLPKWIETLDINHWLKQSIVQDTKKILSEINKLHNIKSTISILENNEYIKKAYIDKIELGEGLGNIEIGLNDNLFYNVLSETTNMNINNEYELISTIKLLSQAKKEYDKVKYAIEEVKTKGYGIVTPTLDEMILEKPELIKHGSRYGIKIKATAPSFHLIKADIQTEVAPIVGSEEQSKELSQYLLEQLENEKDKIWDYNIFGKSLSDLVNDGLNTKLYRIPEDTQLKLQETLQKIINENNGGLICILL